jgi:hypothetical protein
MAISRLDSEKGTGDLVLVGRGGWGDRLHELQAATLARLKSRYSDLAASVSAASSDKPILEQAQAI